MGFHTNFSPRAPVRFCPSGSLSLSAAGAITGGSTPRKHAASTTGGNVPPTPCHLSLLLPCSAGAPTPPQHRRVAPRGKKVASAPAEPSVRVCPRRAARTRGSSSAPVPGGREEGSKPCQAALAPSCSVDAGCEMLFQPLAWTVFGGNRGWALDFSPKQGSRYENRQCQ